MEATPTPKKRGADRGTEEFMTPAPKKSKTQYMLFKDLLAQTPEGKAQTSKEFTAFAKAKSEDAKRGGSAEMASLWAQALVAELADKAAAATATAAWAETASASLRSALDEAVAGASADAFGALANACEAAEAKLPAVDASSADPAAKASLRTALAAAAASLRAHKQAAAGGRATALGAALAAAADAKHPAAALKAALSAAAEFLASFGDAASADLKAGLARATGGAEAALKAIDDAATDAALAAKLQGAGAAALAAHASVYRELKECIEEQESELAALRRFKATAEARQQASAAQASATACSLPRAVGKALQAQMTYVQGLKHAHKPIAYACGGVTPEIFRAAFGPQASGSGATLTASVAGAALGVSSKALRYGACMDLAGPVALKLSGNQLTAKAAYTMHTGGGSFLGFRF